MPKIPPFKIDGKTYFTLWHASEVIGPVLSSATLHRWVTRGHTPWDLDLDIKRQPILKHAMRQTATRRATRLLISENSALLLKRLLQEYRPNPHRPLRFTKDEITNLKSATRGLKLSLSLSPGP
jgi:hypothetical protein